MEIAHDNNPSEYKILAFDPGKIKINDKVYTKSLIVTPTRLLENWGPHSANDLAERDMLLILETDPEVILIGTGEKHLQLSPALFKDCYAAGVGVEVMSTLSACRTFNILASDHRRVTAALLL